MLKNLYGCKNLININSADFQSKFCNCIKDFNRCYYISMLGGEIPGKILQYLPVKSEMVILGNLSRKDLVLPASSFFFQSKKIRGFFLERFIEEELTEQEYKSFCTQIAQDINSGGKCFGTKIAKEMKLDEWN